MTRDPEFEIQYKSARNQFEQERFTEAAKALKRLLAQILGTIVKEYHIYLYASRDFTEAIASIDEGLHVFDWDLALLAELFDRVDIFTHCEGSDLSGNSDFLRSFRYRQLAFLCDSVQEGTWHVLLQRMSIQQVLVAVAALLDALGQIEITGVHFLVNTRELHQFIAKNQDDEGRAESLEAYVEYLFDGHMSTGIGTKVFDIIKLRGMLINRDDNSRNISFKVETLVRILTTILDRARQELTMGGMSESVAARRAQWILFTAGYTSGSAFGKSLHAIFRRDVSPKALYQKIERWCFFDSDVGFGLFTAEEVEEGADALKIRIRLSDNFLVHGKSSEDSNLCSFMCGYIQGILERLTRLPLIIRHSRSECEQYSVRERACTFRLERDDERFNELLAASGEDEQVGWGGEREFAPPTFDPKRICFGAQSGRTPRE